MPLFVLQIFNLLLKRENVIFKLINDCRDLNTVHGVYNVMNVLFLVQIRKFYWNLNINLLLDAIDIVHIFDGLVIYWYVL